MPTVLTFPPDAAARMIMLAEMQNQAKLPQDRAAQSSSSPKRTRSAK